MEILQRALREALDRNAAETVRWTRYKEQHEGAKANIQEFQKSLEVDIMVPIGTKALIPGRLYHTNEILVSHSGTYYSKCSAHKALEICQNRLNVAASRLKAFEAEADLHRNQLELPLDFDAFSSEEIIETYDEEEEKQWQVDHKNKMKEFKRKEAVDRQNLMNGKDEDDIIKKLEELELMEELENELEQISEDDEVFHAIVNESTEPTSHKKRISHSNEQANGHVSSSIEERVENIDSLPPNSDDDDDDEDDDDDIPVEFKEIELKAVSMTNTEKLKLFKAKFADVQDYLQTCRPRTIEEISHKTDKMFFSDHLLNAIETIQDELNCDHYLNGVNEESDNDMLPSVISEVISTSAPKQTNTILKKKISIGSEDEEPDNRSKKGRRVSFASETDVKWFSVSEERKVSFALEDDVKSFDVWEEPSKISSTVIFDDGPVLNLSVNHSDAVFIDTNEKSDIIRSPVDIYKQFAECTSNGWYGKPRSRVVPKKEIIKYSWESKDQPSPLDPIQSPQESKGQPSPLEIKSPQESKDQLSPQEIENERDVAAAKIEVKEMLDKTFYVQNTNEPDPLPQGNFVDTHEPKKRVSLFKQRRQMKTQ